MESKKTIDLLWRIIETVVNGEDDNFHKTINEFCKILNLTNLMILEINGKPRELFRRGFDKHSFSKEDVSRVKALLDTESYYEEKITGDKLNIYVPIGRKYLFSLIVAQISRQTPEFVTQNIRWLGMALYYGMTNSNAYLLKKNQRMLLIEDIKKQLERIIDTIPMPISIHDRDYNIIRVNKSLAEALNMQYKDIIGKKCYEIMHPERKVPDNCPLKKVKTTKKAISVETKDSYPFEGVFVTTVKDISDTSDNANLYLHVIQNMSNERELTRGVIQAVETERKALSSEIHDDLLQAGFSAMTHCNSVYQRIRNKEDRRRLELAIKSIEGLLLAGRKIIKELRPPLLETVGLISAIKEHAKNIFEGYPIVVNIAESRIPKIPIELETTIFRVVQESLMNVLKHSKASEVKISINKKHNKIIDVEISDNGIGLPAELQDMESKEHIGMKLMKERIEMHHGCFCIASKPEKGTKIKATFPVSPLYRVTQESCYGKL